VAQGHVVGKATGPVDHPKIDALNPNSTARCTGAFSFDRCRRSPNGCYGTSTWDQSALMPTDLITLAHFSVSSAMSLPKSAGETTSGVTPKTASRAFILGSARPALISLLSLSMISPGVFLGTPRPCQLPA